MQTALSERYKNTPQGVEAEAILRSCVHCGFCNATCPTYQLLGDELDGPRGRIYLMKAVLEGAEVTTRTQQHLDRCLTCRACETTCPSGVQYGRLVDIGREIVEHAVGRSWWERLQRWALHAVVPHPQRFVPLLRLGRALRPLLPAALKHAVPLRNTDGGAWPAPRHARRMLILEGCVQPSIAPNINAAAARVLDALGISLLRADAAGCCGALSQHLNEHDAARAFMRRNIDAWWPHIEAGAEAIIITASGCGTQVKDYGYHLRDDPAYADKAERVSALCRDIAEVVAPEDLARLTRAFAPTTKVAFHSPCSLQHGQQIVGKVEGVLTRLGYTLTPVPDAHLCCGAAGTYAILQRELSQRLCRNKLAALETGGPAVIATANIGCLAHIQSQAAVPVRHWIELLDPARAGVSIKLPAYSSTAKS